MSFGFIMRLLLMLLSIAPALLRKLMPVAWMAVLTDIVWEWVQSSGAM
jgi:hypothetical protein